VSPSSVENLNPTQVEKSISVPPGLNNGRKQKALNVFGDDGLTFWDLLDIINPLQHIPGISTLYRTITNDQIDPAAKMAGGVLYGGPLGLVSSIIDVAVKYSTGKDIGTHAVALAQPEETEINTKESPSNKRVAAEHGIRGYYSRVSNPYLAVPDPTDIRPKPAQRNNVLDVFYMLPVYQAWLESPAGMVTNKTERVNQFNDAVIAYQKGFNTKNGALINSATLEIE
jgi:hypothetical protein